MLLWSVVRLAAPRLLPREVRWAGARSDMRGVFEHSTTTIRRASELCDASDGEGTGTYCYVSIVPVCLVFGSIVSYRTTTPYDTLRRKNPKKLSTLVSSKNQSGMARRQQKMDRFLLE